jgi:hypothetical protein
LPGETFLLCLVIPFRHLRPLVVIVTAFTVAHSQERLVARMESNEIRVSGAPRAPTRDT